MFLLLVICDHALDISSQFYILMVPYFLHPLKNILLSCESYLLMGIALERLIAVVRPIWYRTSRLRLSGWRHAAVFILPTLVISVSLNIPKFLELELVYTNVTGSSDKVTEVMNLEVSSLRLNSDYILYYVHWTRSLATGVIPMLFLLVTNSSIYISLRRQQPWVSHSRSTITVLSPYSIENRKKIINQNRRSALTLTAIVIMYILCNTPRLVINLAEYLYQDQLYQDYDHCGCIRKEVWYGFTIRLSHLLLTVNSSANFIIYWSLGRKFKSTLHSQATGILSQIGRLQIHSHAVGPTD